MEAQYKVVEETELALDAVNPAVYNPRKISGQQFQSLKKNIKKYGILERLIINRRTGNTLVSGHQRLKVARELGFETVPVRVIDCDEKNEQILNLALNKIEGSFDNKISLPYHERGVALCEDYYLVLINAFFHRKCLVDFRFLENSTTFRNTGGLSEYRSTEGEKEAYLYLKKKFGNAIKRKPQGYTNEGKPRKASSPYERVLNLPF